MYRGYGTCDCIIIADDVMRVIDMKYGKAYRSARTITRS